MLNLDIDKGGIQPTLDTALCETISSHNATGTLIDIISKTGGVVNFRWRKEVHSWLFQRRQLQKHLRELMVDVNASGKPVDIAQAVARSSIGETVERTTLQVAGKHTT